MLAPILQILTIVRFAAVGDGCIAHIQVFNRVGAPEQAVKTAIVHAQKVFEKAGVPTHWRFCPNPKDVLPSQACPVEDGAFSLGVVREDRALYSQRDSYTIGYTLRASDRNNAAVIWPRIQKFAEQLGVNADLLLGFAMAHEIGHLLCPVGHHSTGVMDHAWDRSDAIHMARGTFGFCDRDVEHMRRYLAKNKKPGGSFPQTPPTGSAFLPR